MENKLADKILNSSEKLWLETIYSKLKNGESFNERKLRVELSNDLSRGFSPEHIDSRLLRNSLNLALLGTALINPKSYLVAKADKVIQAVRCIISSSEFTDADIKSQEISRLTKISEKDVELILGMLGETGFYHSFGTAYEGKYFNSIKIDDEAFKKYLDYENISQCLNYLVQQIYFQQLSDNNFLFNDAQTKVIPFTETKNAPSNNMQNQIDKRKVFVVHGRNYQVRDAMFNFLRSIDLDPIEWSEAIRLSGQGSPYVGNVLEAAFNTAQAIVVLMTPDDEARLLEPYRDVREPIYETEYTPQPRQNVLIEAGMALGKDASRTILVEVGEIRPISDLIGRHTVRLNNSVSKRQDIIDRLEAAGCEVNIKGRRDWQTVGNFEIPVVEKTEPDSEKEIANIPVVLNDIDLSILKIVSEKKDGVGSATYLNRLERELNLHSTRLDYHLNKLAEQGYLVEVPIMMAGQERSCYLTAKGISYVVENGLV